MVKLWGLVHYEDIDCWVAVAREPYRQHWNNFYLDRRVIPERWVAGVIKSYIASGRNYFSAPFDGVSDFQFIRDGQKPTL
jgi:hypothetical protein